MVYRLGYGKAYKEFSIDEANILSEVRQNQLEAITYGTFETGAEKVIRSLCSPIGSPTLKKIVSPGEKIVIITSDITRPFPGQTVIPAVLDELSSAGIPDSDVTVVFATGSHRRHTEAEKKYLTGDSVYSRIRCIDSDPND